LTELAVQAIRNQIHLSGANEFLFPSDLNSTGHQKSLRSVWRLTLKRARVRYFRIYDLRSTYATRLSAGGVADEWVTQLSVKGMHKSSKVLADEAANATRSFVKNQSPRKRNAVARDDHWHSKGQKDEKWVVE
jgi:integrase